MSDTPHQSQQSGTPVNDRSTNTIYTSHNGCMVNVNGTTLSNVQQSDSYPKQNNKPATGGGGVDGKCLNKEDHVAASDGRGEIQTTPRATHAGKDEHGALYIPHDLIPLDPGDITLDHVEEYFQDYYRYFAIDSDVRKSFDDNKGYHLDYNELHGEKFKIILTDLHQLIKNEGHNVWENMWWQHSMKLGSV